MHSSCGFFFGEGGAIEIPLGFKIVAIWVAVCDTFLGWQWLAFGNGESEAA